MGDIKPKPQMDPPSDPDLNPIQDQALGEDPGASVTMPDIAGWNAEAPDAPTPAPKGYFPPVDLIGAWQRAYGPPPPPPQAHVAHPEAVAEAGEVVTGFHLPVSNRLLVTLTVLGVVVVTGLGGSYYLFFRSKPEPAPVAVTTPRATPTHRSTPRPSFRPSPRPVSSPGRPPAPAPQPGQRTYTVVAGDTLITIGERFGVDWRQIATINGQITDPNFITPGQVLKIP